METACRRVLIAGMGFLGVELGRRARAAGWEVVGLGRSAATPAQRAAVDDWVSADLANLDSLHRVAAGAGTFSWVLHCASSGRGGPEHYREVYLAGCRNLLEVFDEARLGFTSSTSVFGQTGGEWVDEATPTSPPTATAGVLAETEAEVLAAAGTVLRLAGLYGPGRSVLLQRFLAGEAVIEVPAEAAESGAGEGEKPVASRWINQIHVQDAARAWLALIGADPQRVAGEIFHAADGQPRTQRQIQEFLADHSRRPLPPEAPPDPNRKRGLTSKRVDSRKLRDLGWTPEFPSFPDAVRSGSLANG